MQLGGDVYLCRFPEIFSRHQEHGWNVTMLLLDCLLGGHYTFYHSCTFSHFPVSTYCKLLDKSVIFGALFTSLAAQCITFEEEDDRCMGVYPFFLRLKPARVKPN